MGSWANHFLILYIFWVSLNQQPTSLVLIPSRVKKKHFNALYLHYADWLYITYTGFYDGLLGANSHTGTLSLPFGYVH